MDYKAKALSLIDKNYEQLLSKLEEFRNGKGEKTVLWGTGAIAHVIFQYLKRYGQTIDYFCDNDVSMTGQHILDDIVCLSTEEVLKMQDADIIIASTSIDAIETQIRNSGFEGNIIVPPTDALVFMSIVLSDLEKQSKQLILDSVAQVFDIVSDEISREILYFKIWGWFATPEEMKDYVFDKILMPNQYIPNGIIQIDKDSTIVDCGAYVGDTLDFFIKHGVQFQRYIAYELDKNNFDSLSEFVETYDKNLKQRIAIHNLGVGDSENSVSFFSKKYSSLILDTSDSEAACEETGKIVDLDTHLNGCDVTYIKMDIEGFEMSALKGAEKLIKQKHPDCAICIYHKATDLWQIPLFLKSCYSEYQFYIRHHADCYFDTVCYAIGGSGNEMEK